MNDEVRLFNEQQINLTSRQLEIDSQIEIERKKYAEQYSIEIDRLLRKQKQLINENNKMVENMKQLNKFKNIADEREIMINEKDELIKNCQEKCDRLSNSNQMLRENNRQLLIDNQKLRITNEKLIDSTQIKWTDEIQSLHQRLALTEQSLQLKEQECNMQLDAAVIRLL